MFGPNYPALNVSNAWNPFNYGKDSGRLTLVNEVPWVPAPYPNDLVDTFAYPNATLQRVKIKFWLRKGWEIFLSFCAYVV
jgi:hypothetical protein